MQLNESSQEEANFVLTAAEELSSTLFCKDCKLTANLDQSTSLFTPNPSPLPCLYPVILNLNQHNLCTPTRIRGWLSSKLLIHP